jgi:hypothetical protein
MIKKIYIYLQSGGFLEVAKYAFIGVKKIFYYKSETIFYFLDREHLNDTYTIKNSSVVFKTIKNVSDLQKIDFDRIKVLNHRKWFEKGSLAIIGFSSSVPVSFTWMHFYSHCISGVCTIKLSPEQCWAGPSFVIKSQRGKKINQAQKRYLIRSVPESIRYFLTSVNKKNIASIKSLEKIGFSEGLRIIKYRGIFQHRKPEVVYKNDGDSIFKIKL